MRALSSHPCGPMEKARDCGSEGLGKPGFNPQPSIKYFFLLFFISTDPNS